MKLLTITGNIGYNAIIKEANGQSFLQFTVAVNERYKKSSGEQVETTDWINCTCPVLSLQKYLLKGTRVCCIGHMKQNIYKSRDGQYCAGLNLRVIQVDFLGGNRQSVAQEDATVGDAPEPAKEPIAQGNDDLPF